MSAEEWWDVTDRSGRPTGERFRSGDEGWPEGGFHILVAVCARRDDGHVLVSRRAADKSFPLAWELPGGSAWAGESSAEAASRELAEETGLHVRPGSLEFAGRFVEESALLDVFVTPPLEEPILEPDPAEVSEAEWVPPAEVTRRCRDGSMAEPWGPRLEALWPQILAILERRVV